MGDRGQEFINKPVLRSADLLVAIFEARLGSPTGGYESGTVEEIKKHQAEGKPTMIYFSTTIDTSNLDMAEFQRVNDFKHWCKENGLYGEFSSPENFRETFRRHLQQKINEHPAFRTNEASATPSHIDGKSARTENAASPSGASGLPEHAHDLLRMAATSDDGQILVSENLDGLSIQISGENINDGTTPREQAKLVAGLNDLVKLGYIHTKVNRHDLKAFEMTDAGYEHIDAHPDFR